MKLSQSNVIFFCLFAAFVVFITLRGELPKYLDVLFTTKTGGETNSAGASGGGSGIPGIGGLGNAIESLTGDNLLGRAATSLRGSLGSVFSAGGALGGIFQ